MTAQIFLFFFSVWMKPQHLPLVENISWGKGKKKKKSQIVSKKEEKLLVLNVALLTFHGLTRQSFLLSDDKIEPLKPNSSGV